MAPTAYRTLLMHEAGRADGRSIASIIQLMLADAYIRSASDVHIDPSDNGIGIRLRILGELTQPYLLPLSIHAELISRLKILSHLRIDEHFRAQDGRFTFSSTELASAFDIRISILPSFYGECAVLRLLVGAVDTESLEGLGVPEPIVEEIRGLCGLGYGLLLIAGPTGSGKSTTLSALVRELATTNRSVISIEDPVEYVIPGVRQMPVRPQYGLSFADGLRAILRQDPDVIAIGEIRDTETAHLAITAATTGHLVLSTIHSSGTEGVRTRMEELGIDEVRLARVHPFILSQALVVSEDSNVRRAVYEIQHA